MKPARILRIAVIAEIVLMPVSVAFSFWADSLLPSAVTTLEENQKNVFTESGSIGLGVIAFMVSALAMFGAWVASLIGLLMLKRWGAWLYLVTILFGLPVYFMIGFDVRHPIDQIFDSIFYFMPGFIISLAFFSDALPKTDSEPHAPSNDGNARV